MLDLFLNSLINFGVKTNIVTSSGVGVLIFSREKKYTAFRYLSILFLMLGVAIVSIASYFLNMFVYEKLDLVEIKIGVAVIIASLLNLAISFLWKRISKFSFYLYESSCSYVFDLIFMVYVSMIMDFTLEIVPFLMSVASVLIVIFVMNMLIGFYVDSINKSSLNVCFRNVAARLYIVAIFAIVIYYGSLLI